MPTSLLCRWVVAHHGCQVATKLRDLAQAIVTRRAAQLPRGLAATASGAAALAAALALGPHQLLDVPPDLRAQAQVGVWEHRPHTWLLFLPRANSCLHSSFVEIDKVPAAS